MKQKPINWTAIAAIGQLFSAVAVALTLIYLTMQIRRAEIAASDANRLARANGVVTFWLEAMHDPEFREAGLRINPNNREWTAEISRRMEISEADANPPPPPDREALYRRLDELGIGKPRPAAEEADKAAGK